MRVGGKVNDKDTKPRELLEYRWFQKSNPSPRFQTGASTAIYFHRRSTSLVPNLEQAMLSHAGPARVLIRSGPSDNKFLERAGMESEILEL
jgi:hypothetical protein